MVLPCKLRSSEAETKPPPVPAGYNLFVSTLNPLPGAPSVNRQIYSTNTAEAQTVYEAG